MAGIKQMIGGTFEDVGEAATDLAKDTVGQSLEQGAQAVSGKQLNPQQMKQAEEKRVRNLAYVRNWIGNHIRSMQKVNQEAQQKERLRLQAQQSQQPQQTEEMIQARKANELHPSISQKQTAAENKNRVGE